jgi:hypothetical protein
MTLRMLVVTASDINELLKLRKLDAAARADHGPAP